MEIKLHPCTLVRVLFSILAVLFVLHIVAWLPPILTGRDYTIRYFDFGLEQNLPTLFSTGLLLLSSGLTLLIAVTEKKKGQAFICWAVLSAVFLMLGIDETIMIHEKVSDLLHEQLNTTGMFRFVWVLPYGLAAVVFGLSMLRFYLRLPADTKKWIAFAAFTYVLGAIGIEMAGSARYSSNGFDSWYTVISTIEEILEMCGAILFVYAFSRHIDQHLDGTRIRITSQREG
ncbi:MAG: hypothetical protein V3V05_09045 [Pontiella sp.]